ncbi:MAG: hypothetical protein Q9168_007025 [Polycauliona sp. 1 TL-2023]
MYPSNSIFTTTLTIVSLPFSILAAPTPDALYIITAGTITPNGYTPTSTTKNFSLTIRGTQDGALDIVCAGDARIDQDTTKALDPRVSVSAQLPCSDPNGNVIIVSGNDQNVFVRVWWG